MAPVRGIRDPLGTWSSFSKNTYELDIVLSRIVNILTTNKLIKLTMLWTMGPTFQSFVLSGNIFTAYICPNVLNPCAAE